MVIERKNEHGFGGPSAGGEFGRERRKTVTAECKFVGRGEIQRSSGGEWKGKAIYMELMKGLGLRRSAASGWFR